MPLKILYIVQTFAPVGGMERYVFETAREMVSRGHDVTAFCRATEADMASEVGVRTVVLRPQPSRRGWQDRLVFREAVSKFFRQNPGDAAFDIIHSHENTVEQQVSTEHGPCTLAGLRRAPWKFLDYSAVRNLVLERAKFAAPSLAALATCSAQVENTLLDAYPKLRGKTRAVIPPAFSSYLPDVAPKSSENFTLGFIGADWRRKGLPKAVEIFRKLRAGDARWTMVVAGVEASRLPPSLVSASSEGVTFAGRVPAEGFFAGVDVLVHPARDEPFGMVVTESLSCGVPAVVSDRCGCVPHVRAEGLKVIGCERSAEEWARACGGLVGMKARLLTTRTWADVAGDHERLYERVLSSRLREPASSSA